MSLFERIIPFFLSKEQVIKTESVSMEEIEEIYCFSNTAIGDTLFNTPVFRSLKKNFPNKKLIAVLNPSNYTLFETNPYIDEILLYSGKTKHFFSTLRKLKQRDPKLVLILHSNEPQATPLAVLSGARYILKFPNEKTYFNKWHTNRPTPFDFGYTIYDKIKYLQYLGVDEKKDTFDVKMDLFLPQKSVSSVKKRLDSFHDKILIGFQIGASSRSRMWYDEQWIRLGKKLLEKYPDVIIVLTGAPNEKQLTDKVEAALGTSRVLNLAGYFDLLGAAALLGELNLLITPDTGPLHIAAALGTPTIALYAVMNHIITNPAFDESIHLYVQKPLTCDPCITRKCKDPFCMLQIDPEQDVMPLIEKLLVDSAGDVQ